LSSQLFPLLTIGSQIYNQRLKRPSGRAMIVNDEYIDAPILKKNRRLRIVINHESE
jgi:hypothetical protein